MRVHDSRDQLVNRKLARKLLYDKLDKLVNGDTSKLAMREKREQRSKDRQRRRREKKLKEGASLTEIEGDEDSDLDNDEEEEDLSKYDDIKLDKIGKDIK